MHEFHIVSPIQELEKGLTLGCAAEWPAKARYSIVDVYPSPKSPNHRSFPTNGKSSAWRVSRQGEHANHRAPLTLHCISCAVETSWWPDASLRPTAPRTMHDNLPMLKTLKSQNPICKYIVRRDQRFTTSQLLGSLWHSQCSHLSVSVLEGYERMGDLQVQREIMMKSGALARLHYTALLHYSCVLYVHKATFSAGWRLIRRTGSVLKEQMYECYDKRCFSVCVSFSDASMGNVWRCGCRMPPMSVVCDRILKAGRPKGRVGHLRRQSEQFRNAKTIVDGDISVHQPSNNWDFYINPLNFNFPYSLRS